MSPPTSPGAVRARKLSYRLKPSFRFRHNVSDEIASGVSVTYGTAIHGLKDRGRLCANEWVAVLGASGGAGLAAIEIAKQLGARVIAVASSPDKLEICRKHGADVLINYSAGDLKDALKAATDGNGVDVVYDCVGGDFAEPAVRALAWGGRFLVIGFAAGSIPKLPLNLLLLKGADAIGVFWGESVRRDPQGHRDNMTAVLQWVSEGKLVPHIHATYPLADTAEAIRVLDRQGGGGQGCGHSLNPFWQPSLPRQRHWIVGERAQVGDDVRDLGAVADAGERHLRAGRIAPRIVEEHCQVLVRPHAAARFQRS